MKVDIEYDGNVIPIQIPDGNLMGVIAPSAAENPLTAENLLAKLLETTHGVDLRSFLDGIRTSGEELLIIINDGQRPTSSRVVLESLLPSFKSLPSVRVSIATGTHKPPSEGDFLELLGKTFAFFRQSIHIHKAKDVDDHVYLGKTSRGTKVQFDRVVCDVANILVIGSMEPHYFAGFTGGRKAFLPGHAAYETIEHNHSFALKTEATLLNLRDNPVHLDMLEGCDFLKNKNIYSIQLVLDCCGNIAHAFGGELDSSFEAGIAPSKENFTKEVPQLADIVLTVAEYPMDRSLYQSQKAMENAKLALKDDGILILVSATREGIGNSTFANLLSSSDDLDEILDVIEKGYVWGYHKTAKIIEAIKRYKVLVVSGLENQIVRELHMEPVSSPQEAVDIALDEKGKNAKILVMPKGSALVPIISNGNSSAVK